MFMRLYLFIAFISAIFLYYTPSADAQTSNYTFQQNDFVLQKICVPKSQYASNQYTPAQCTTEIGTLRDVTSTDLLTYIHGDYPNVVQQHHDGTAIIEPGTCKSYLGISWIYMFPLIASTGGNILDGTDSTNIRHQLYVHWISDAGNEYNVNTIDEYHSQINCGLNSNTQYANDSFGLVTELQYTPPGSSTAVTYMTLLGEDLPCGYSKTASTSAAACRTTTDTNPEPAVNQAATSPCQYLGECPRQYGWSVGNNFNNTTGGIQNFDSAWATDLNFTPSNVNASLPIPSFNTVALGKRSYYFDQTLNNCTELSTCTTNCPACYLPAATPYNQVSNRNPLFNSENVSNWSGTIDIDPSISFSVLFNFTFGPAGDYYVINPQFIYYSPRPPATPTITVNNANPVSGALLNTTLPTMLQYGFVEVYNNDAPMPYTGPGSDSAGESEHVYSTQLYGYATRWELWHEVDMAPMAAVNAVNVYEGGTCSRPENPYASTNGVVNSDFTYGDPTTYAVPIAMDADGNMVSQPGANVTVGANYPYSYLSVPSAVFVGGGTTRSPTGQTIDPNGTPYANTSVIITAYGIFSFAPTTTDPVHYPVYLWPTNTTDFSNPTSAIANASTAHPAPILTGYGGTTMAVGSDSNGTYVFLEAGGNGRTAGNWYKWVPTTGWTFPTSPSTSPPSPGTWVGAPAGYASPTNVVVSPAWANTITVTQGTTSTSNVWFMVGCTDYTNAWNANDIATQLSGYASAWKEQLSIYPGTTGQGNNDFAHVIGSNYLTYFGVPAFQ